MNNKLDITEKDLLRQNNYNHIKNLLFLLFLNLKHEDKMLRKEYEDEQKNLYYQMRDKKV